MAKKEPNVCVQVAGENICAPNTQKLLEQLNNFAINLMSTNYSDDQYLELLQTVMGMYESCRYFTTENKCYKKPQVRKVKGIMLHSPQDTNSDAERIINKYFNKELTREGKGAPCVNAVIDCDGKLYQCLPWEWKAWHCGDTMNTSHIGIELCDPKGAEYFTWSAKYNGTWYPARIVHSNDREILGNRKVFNTIDSHKKYEVSLWISKDNQICRLIDEHANENGNHMIEKGSLKKDRPVLFENVIKVRDQVIKQLESAVKICAKLCVMYKLDPLEEQKISSDCSDRIKKRIKKYPKTIVSHSEGYIYFREASNHGDVEKLWGALGAALHYSGDHEFTMNYFRKKVAEEIAKMSDDPEHSYNIGVRYLK